jgi:hypothetical protein
MTEKANPNTKPVPTAAHNTAKPAAASKTPAAKQAVKSTAKKPAAAPLATKPKTANAEKSPKADKPKKIKMVRDSFTMPENDYAQLAELKKRCLQAGVHVKKSELLRAGLLSLSKLPNAALIKAVGQVERLKTGRPAKS